MPPPEAIAGAPGTAAAHDDLLHILGEIDERKALEILALQPTVADVEEAAVWVAGNGDLLAKAGHPLTGIPAGIVEILTADEEDPPPSG